MKRAGADVPSEVDYQPKVKRSQLKSVDVITTARHVAWSFLGWTMEVDVKSACRRGLPTFDLEAASA